MVVVHSRVHHAKKRGLMQEHGVLRWQILDCLVLHALDLSPLNASLVHFSNVELVAFLTSLEV